jgi:hypothetical protein
MISTFFEGSVEDAVAALLDLSAGNLSPQELDRIQGVVERIKQDSAPEGSKP